MGIVSIIIGILVGMLFVSVVGNFLMNGMEILVKGSYVFVYILVILVIVIFFLILFFIIGLMNSVWLLCKIELELICEDEILDEVKKSKICIIIMIVFGVLLVSIGYYFMINVKIYVELGFIIVIIVIIFGIYFIFSLLFLFFVMKIKGNKKWNEIGLNSFIYV